MLDMLFFLAILGMLITRKQYTIQAVERERWGNGERKPLKGDFYCRISEAFSNQGFVDSLRNEKGRPFRSYFAYSVLRVSRMTFTRI